MLAAGDGRESRMSAPVKAQQGRDAEGYKAVPHGLYTTLKDQISRDLLEFCKA
jgi:hypothetical protein